MSEFLGIGLVTMSIPPALAITTGTCEDYDSKCISHTHKVIFYIGMALIAVGVAGNLVSVKPFLDEQHEDNRHDKDGGAREFYKLLVLVLVVIIPIVGVVAPPYENPGSLRFGILAICTIVATLLFLNGVFLSVSWAYKTCKPQGSPITSVFRLFFAAVSKIFQPFPQDNPQRSTNVPYFRYYHYIAKYKSGRCEEELETLLRLKSRRCQNCCSYVPNVHNLHSLWDCLYFI